MFSRWRKKNNRASRGLALEQPATPPVVASLSLSEGLASAATRPAAVPPAIRPPAVLPATPRASVVPVAPIPAITPAVTPAVTAKPLALDQAAFEKEGFPARVARSFVDTAEELDAVISSRCPLAPATQLIDDGHDMKSYYVHAKSCNWGPMAGFVCHLPPLNKKGLGHAATNLKENAATVDKFKAEIAAAQAKHDLALKASAAAGATTAASHADQAIEREGLTALPFVPTAISTLALQRLFDQDFLDINHCKGYDKAKRVATAPVLGCCWNKNRDVMMEFVLLPLESNAALTKAVAPSPGWWSVYHRQIWVRKTKEGPFEPYLSAPAPNAPLVLAQEGPQASLTALDLPTSDRCELNAADAAALDQMSAAWANSAPVATLLPSSLPRTLAYPVRGACNPYPPYPARDARNAVAGDYDLFAIWPRLPESRFQDTLRRAEAHNTLPATAPPLSRELFRRVERRPFTAALANAPCILLEVIPGFEEIKPWEDALMGNFTDVGLLAAGMLNSLMSLHYKRTTAGRATPNGAFHSDEGGRPGVNEIEYPVAVFLPKDLRMADRPNATPAGGIIVRDHGDFMDLLERLNKRCDLPLNFGWLMHMLLDMARVDQLEALRVQCLASVLTEELKTTTGKFIDARVEAVNKRLAGDPRNVRLRLARLLTGHPNPLADPTANALFEHAIQTFIDLCLLQLQQQPETPVARMVERLFAAAPAAVPGVANTAARTAAQTAAT